jgi:hypothetical protein
MEIDLSKDDIGLMVAAMALSRVKFQEPELSQLNELISKLKAEKQIMVDMDVD